MRSVAVTVYHPPATAGLGVSRPGFESLAVIVLALLGTCPAARAQSPVDGFDPGANNTVYALAIQADGKCVVGGDFTTLGGGGTGVTTRNRIGRLNADGSLDTAFDPGANAQVFSLAVQADGKILVGGEFTTLGGGGTGTTLRRHIGRLNADGSLDTSFDPGANAFVRTVVVQRDGKILLGGDFAMLGGGGAGTTPRRFLGRLHADGSIDTSFDPGANSVVSALAEQGDRKILVGGAFTTLGGGGSGTTPRNRLGRLNSDGSLDTAFDSGVNSEGVRVIAVQADRKILVGGDFTMLGGGASGMALRHRIGRLNADGSLDIGFDPGASAIVFAVTVQPNGAILVGGGFTTLGGGGSGTIVRSRIGRLNADGSIDGSFDPGASDRVRAVAVQPDDSILVGGAFTTLGGGGTGATLRNHLGRLYADGALDADFNPGATAFVPPAGTSPYIAALAVQPDGKILAAGYFTTLGGGATTPRNNIGRLLGDGSLDASFDPGANSAVVALAVQPDGKIVVGGSFNALGGGTGTTTRWGIGRLNGDGTLDESFNPGAGNGTGVLALGLHEDGKILVAGGFTTLGGGGNGTTARQFIGRLNADGSLDESFNPGANSVVNAIALQVDGKILVGGRFTQLGGGTGTTTRNRIARLNADGSIDDSFNPGANDPVDALAVQPDGKIVVGGHFTALGGGTGTVLRSYIGRLNADGTVDPGFDPRPNHEVVALGLQPDGKILAGGYFTGFGFVDPTLASQLYIARLEADGSVDPGFQARANNNVVALAATPDGKILVGGGFTSLGTVGSPMLPRSLIGRFASPDAAIQRLRVTASGREVTWTRRGAGPDVWRVTFESSTDGTTYTRLGSGTRVAEGWHLTGQHLAADQNLYIRARGWTGDGKGHGSIVESVRVAYVAYEPFTDDVLAAGSSVIRAAHITELRSRIDVLRMRYGLSGFAWTGAPLGAGAMARAVHLTELRTALQDAYLAAGQSAPTFTDATVVPGSTPIRVAHIQELRNAVIALEAS